MEVNTESEWKPPAAALHCRSEHRDSSSIKQCFPLSVNGFPPFLSPPRPDEQKRTTDFLCGSGGWVCRSWSALCKSPLEERRPRSGVFGYHSCLRLLCPSPHPHASLPAKGVYRNVLFLKRPRRPQPPSLCLLGIPSVRAPTHPARGPYCARTACTA